MKPRPTQADRRAPPWPKRPERKPPIRALLVLNADGYVEVYGPPELTVHVALRLATDGNAAEQTADEFLTVTLPPKYRDLFFPLNLRATGICEWRSAADELDRRAKLAILHDLRDFREARE